MAYEMMMMHCSPGMSGNSCVVGGVKQVDIPNRITEEEVPSRKTSLSTLRKPSVFTLCKNLYTICSLNIT